MKLSMVALMCALALMVACSAKQGGTSGSGGFGGSGGAGALGGAGGVGAFGGTGGFAAFGGTGGVAASGGVSGGGAGGVAGSSCAMGMASAARVTPTVMLVVDGSCSMSTEYPGNGTPDTIACTQSATNRWSTLRSALVDPTNGVVSRLAGVVKFGLGVYGTVSPSGMMCPFVLGRIDPALNNAQAIATNLPMTPPGLSTPTAEALTQVFQFLPDSTAVLDQDLGPQIVVLATDGAPNSCNDVFTQTQAQSLAAAMMGPAKHIQMFVISMAAPSNTALQQHLQQMANVGAGMDAATGTATLFAPTDPAALSAALEQIIGGAVGCDVALNGRVSVGRECSGSVLLNSTQELGCNDPNGWVLVDESHIRLQGIACDMFKENTAAFVTANFPCDVFIPE